MTSGIAMSVAQASITLLGVAVIEGGRVVGAGINEQFLPQQLSVIAGPMGSGQHSLLCQIAGQETPVKGSVVIGALPLEDLDLQDYRDQVTCFLQPPPLDQLRRCRAPIVLLEDPTAGLSLDAEVAMVNALVVLATQRTVICSSTSAKLTEAADHVVTLSGRDVR